MSVLTLTPAQRVVVDNMATYLHDALAYGVSDGSTTFIEAMFNYLLKLPAELQVKTKEFMQAAFAASLASGFLTSATARAPSAFISEVEYGANAGANVTTNASSSITMGNTVFATDGSLVMTGIRFWWDGAGARTVRLSLWDGVTDTKLATVDVAANGAGSYTGTFASPVTLTPFREYRISKRDQDSAHRWFASDANISTQTGTLMGSGVFYGKPSEGWVRAAGCYSPGATDEFPSTNDSSAIYLLDPVFSA